MRLEKMGGRLEKMLGVVRERTGVVRESVVVVVVPWGAVDTVWATEEATPPPPGWVVRFTAGRGEAPASCWKNNNSKITSNAKNLFQIKMAM